MLSIYVGGNAAGLLSLSNDVQSESSLTGTLRSVNLDNAATRHASDTHSNVQAQRGSRNRRYIGYFALAKSHNRSLAKPLFNVCQRSLYCFAAIYIYSVI